MNVQEMETAKRLGSNIIVMVWEDHAYGLIAWKQDNEFGRHTDLDFGNPDWREAGRGLRLERLSRCDNSARPAGDAREASFAADGPMPRRDPDRLPREQAAHRAPRQHRLPDLELLPPAATMHP